VKSKTEKLLDELVGLHPKYIDLSLNRVNKLLDKLGNPHHNLPKTIHIAGTNGKGSVQSFIRNIIVANGYSCDAYISPHLYKFNERIIINNKEISTKKLYETLKIVKKINNNNPITFFEITTAVGFLLFSKSKSDFLILETGLGGRLDATNILKNKICSIITPISFDHEEFLGKSIEKITKEKLGITKKSNYILISKQSNVVNKIIKNNIPKNKTIFYYGKDYNINKILDNKYEFRFKDKKLYIQKPKLNGNHQIENASVACACIYILKDLGIKFKTKLINNSIKNTSWPGRLEKFKYKNKTIIFDGSHNIDGAKKLNIFLKESKIKPLVVFGMLNNKKLNSFLKILKKQIKFILAVEIPNEKNSFKTNEIKKACLNQSIECKEIKDFKKIFNIIKKTKDSKILITGSLYLVGKLRNRFL